MTFHLDVEYIDGTLRQWVFRGKVQVEGEDYTKLSDIITIRHPKGMVLVVKDRVNTIELEKVDDDDDDDDGGGAEPMSEENEVSYA